MRRFVIQLINFSLLFIILVGVPAIAHAHIGSWEISSAPAARQLIFWGLGLSAGLNAIGALQFSKKERRLCLEWAIVFGALWLAYFGFTHGWFDFEWLKRALRWLQKQIGRG